MISLHLHKYLPVVTAFNHFLRIIAISSIFLLPNLSSMVHAEKRYYSIQLGSFRELNNASSMVNDLKRLGHNAFYRYETVKGKGKLYRVYIERYRSRKEAVKEAKTLKKLELISDYAIKAIDEIAQDGSRDRKHDKKVYYLHIGSFKEKSNAEKMVQELGKSRYKAFFVAEEISGVSLFRVYIGEFNDEKEAQKIGSELRNKGIISYFNPIEIDKQIILDRKTE